MKIVIYLVLVVILSAFSVNGFEDDALLFERGNFNSMESSEVSDGTSNGFFRKMMERGKILIKSLPKTLDIFRKIAPTPASIFNLSKQYLVGLPQEAIAYAINHMCSAAVHSNIIKPSNTPSVKLMNFQLFSLEGDVERVPLLFPKTLLNHSAFNPEWNTTLLVTGWNTNPETAHQNPCIQTLLRAYRTRNMNFVVFDTSDFIDSLYSWSAFNTDGVGKIIGSALAELSDVVDIDGIHLIGHSLGAHICGYAGREFTNLTNKLLPRITGFDPARPCFNEGERLNGLQRGDAQFVDIIHSNAGILGIKESRGDVDFYPNGKHPLQPGCWTIMCSHNRAYEFFAETVYEGNEKNFMSTQCNSISSLRDGRCSMKRIPMGIDTPTDARGNYFLETNKKSPFGKPMEMSGRFQLLQRSRERLTPISERIAGL